jgi:hypothetical protein
MRIWTAAGVVAAGLVGLAGASGLSSAEETPGHSSAKRPTYPGPLYGVLRGANEIGEDGRRGAGDDDGRASASATIDEETRELCFGLTAKNLDEPVAAHIHRGTRGRNGPIVVTLTAPSAGDPGASSGCVEVTDRLARSLTRNPHRYYWNIHTEAFPDGAVRGQVFTRTR